MNVDRLISQKEAARLLAMSSRRLSERRAALGLERHPLSSVSRPKYRLSHVLAIIERRSK